MSYAHKGSRLMLSGNVIATPFNSIHFDYDIDASGINNGQLILPTSDSIYTMRQIEGKFGGGVAIEEGSANLLPISDSNWNLGISGYTGTHTVTTNNNPTFHTTALYNFGPVSAGFSGGTWQVAEYNTGMGGSWVSGNTYTWSIYIRSLTDDTISVRLLDSDGKNPQGATINYSGNIGEWNRISSTWTATNTSGGGEFYMTSSATASFEVADPQVENKSFSTSFVNGSRNNGILSYDKDIISLNKFTVNTWLELNTFGSTDGSWQPIFELTGGSYANNRLLFLINYHSKNIYAYVGGNSSETNFTTPIDSIDQTNNWYMATLSYDGTTYSIYINGQLSATKSYGVAIPKSDATFNIGSKVYGEINGIISDFCIFNNECLSSEEIEALYVSQRPLYNPYDYRSFAY